MTRARRRPLIVWLASTMAALAVAALTGTTASAVVTPVRPVTAPSAGEPRTALDAPRSVIASARGAARARGAALTAPTLSAATVAAARATYVLMTRAQFDQARRLAATGIAIGAAIARVLPKRVAAAPRTAPAKIPSPGSLGCSYWTIQWPPDHDYAGHLIPTRCGDSSFGFTKIVDRHGLVNISIIQRLYQQYPTARQGLKLMYDGVVAERGSLNVVLGMRAVVDLVGFSKARLEHSPDGLILGTNTVYCLTGATLCPAWVNAL
jgi:hypothetical protein